MAILIDGEMLEVEKQPILESIPPAKRRTSFPSSIDEYITDEGLATVYQEFKKNFNHSQDEVEKLEELLRKAGNIISGLNDTQKKNLGYLTTLYTIYTQMDDDGQIKIENLGFLEQFKLQDADYLLAGLTNAKIGELATEGESCLYRSRDITIKKIFSAGKRCLRQAKRVKIGEIVSVEKEFGRSSESIKIGVLHGCKGSFGYKSRKMELRKVESASVYFGHKSIDMRIRQVDNADNNFGQQSEGMQVNTIEEAGWYLGQSSTDFKAKRIVKAGICMASQSTGFTVDYVKFAGESFGSSSTDLNVKKVNAVGDKFGASSTGLIVEKIVNAGDAFASDSTGMNVGQINEVGDRCAQDSTDFNAELIKQVGKGFGINSKGLTVNTLQNVNWEDFMKRKMSPHKHDAAILSMPWENSLDLYNGPNDYVFIDTSGIIHTDMNINKALKVLDVRFSCKPYDGVMGLLNIGNEEDN